MGWQSRYALRWAFASSRRLGLGLIMHPADGEYARYECVDIDIHLNDPVRFGPFEPAYESII